MKISWDLMEIYLTFKELMVVQWWLDIDSMEIHWEVWQPIRYLDVFEHRILSGVIKHGWLENHRHRYALVHGKFICKFR